MGDWQAEKRPMEPLDPEAEQHREKELRDKAKHDQRARAAGRGNGDRCG